MTEPSPFEQLLGAEFALLSEPVRHIHGLAHPLATAGLADIVTARGFLPWLLCAVVGLPQPGRDVPVAVSFEPEGAGREHWQRRFARRGYASTLAFERRGTEGLIVERMRPFTFLFRVTQEANGLRWHLIAWRFAGVTLPRWTVPSIVCHESGEGDRYVFDIDVAFPLVGPVIHYRGWLLPAS